LKNIWSDGGAAAGVFVDEGGAGVSGVESVCGGGQAGGGVPGEGVVGVVAEGGCVCGVTQ